MAAIDDVKNGGLSMYAAAKKYNIPEPTLRRHIHRHDTSVVGRPQAMLPE